jgi:CRP-like cAMP-binding protein
VKNAKRELVTPFTQSWRAETLGDGDMPPASTASGLVCAPLDRGGDDHDVDRVEEIATASKEAVNSATKSSKVVPVNSASSIGAESKPYVAIKDGVDSRSTDSFVPRATLAARCPLLTDEEVGEERAKRSAEVDATAALDDEPEDDVMMVFKLQQHETPPWYIILPNNKKRQWWDLLIVSCVIYNTAVVPLDVAFGTKVLGSLIEGINYTTDILFFFDMIVHLCSAYVEEKENIVILDHKKIVLHYVHSVFFYIDFVSTFPWEFAFLPISNDPNLSLATKLIGCIKLLRLLRLTKFFRWLHDRFGGYVNQVRIFELLFSFLLYSHWVGCMFYMIDVGLYKSEAFDGCDDSRCYFQTAEGSTRADPIQKLDENGEATTLFLAVCSTLGCGLSAVVFGSFADILGNANSIVGLVQHKMDMMTHAMKKVELSPELQERMHEFQEFKTKRLDGMEQLMCFNELSPALKSEVRQSANLEAIRKVDLFRRSNNVRDEMVVMLANTAERCFFAPRDVIFKEGQLNDSMHIVQFGFVAITSSRHPDRFTLTSGEYFGEMALCRTCARQTHVVPILEAAKTNKCTGNAVSITFVETIKVTADNFKLLFKMRGCNALRSSFFLAFKQRAMMLNMLCRSLLWIQVDHCFYAWREMSRAAKPDVSGVSALGDAMKLVLQRIDRLEQKFDDRISGLQEELRVGKVAK